MVRQDASQQIEGKFFLFGNDIFYVWNFKMKDSFRCKTNTQGLIANTVNPQCLLGLTISLIEHQQLRTYLNFLSKKDDGVPEMFPEMNEVPEMKSIPCSLAKIEWKFA